MEHIIPMSMLVHHHNDKVSSLIQVAITLVSHALVVINVENTPMNILIIITLPRFVFPLVEMEIVQHNKVILKEACGKDIKWKINFMLVVS